MRLGEAKLGLTKINDNMLTWLVFILLFFKMVSRQTASSNFNPEIPQSGCVRFGETHYDNYKQRGNSLFDQSIGKAVSTNPTVDLMVRYGAKQVRNGNEFTLLEVARRPYVNFSFHGPSHPNLFTLVMIDPDAPDPRQPVLREILHWMVINIPEGMDVSKGREVVGYLNPTPVSGIHRYMFMLFRQQGAIGRVNPLFQARIRFNTQQFAVQNRLGVALASVYFTAHI